MTVGIPRAERADLGTILRERGALESVAVRALFARLSEAIAASHDAGKAHGDLEPSRVMVWSSGVAGAPFTVELRPGSGGPVTPAWRAPELLAESAPSVQPSADVWSLGLIAFALLTGRSYWRTAASASRAELLDEVLRGPLPPPSERAAELGLEGALPRSFDAWFSRCVTRDAAARFPTARMAGIAFETIMIPQQRESSPLFPLPRGRRVPSSEAPPSRRIVLIDDDRMAHLVLGAHLRKEGYEVASAMTGEEGLTVARRDRPSLILLDYMLPDIDGPEVLRRLRAEADGGDVPVILLTGTELAAHIAEGFRAGANDYLMKPVDPQVLVTRIEAAITAHAKVRRASVIAVRHQKLVADLEEARAEQAVTLSVLPASWPGWWAVGGVAPSGMVGGDLIAIYGSDRGARTAVVVDVAGHGAGAALVAASVRATLGLLLPRFPLVDALAVLNEELGSTGARYACLAAVQVEGNHVTIVNAGLPPVCVARQGEPILQIAPSGVPPGLLPGQTYLATSFGVRPGDRIAVVSDGLVEPFGFIDDALPILRDLGVFDGERWTGREQPLDVEDQLRAELARLSRPQPDDATLLLLGAD